jgi:flavin-dependent dehydrogenase
MPSPTSGWPKRALSLESRMSQAQAISHPPPSATPLTAAITGFGKNELNPAPGLLSVGDAAAFNDPFTGSGMLMAFEGAEILAGCILETRLEPEKLVERYSARFHEKFYLRLRICGALRRLAFVPTLAEAAVVMLGFNRSFAKSVARATRRHSPAAGTDL